MLIVADLHARSTTGGVPVDQQVAHVVTVRDGKVTRSESYSSPADALAAIER